MIAWTDLGICRYRRNAGDWLCGRCESEAVFISVFRFNSLRFEPPVIDSFVDGKAFARRNAMVVISTDQSFKSPLIELVFDLLSLQLVRIKSLKSAYFFAGVSDSS